MATTLRFGSGRPCRAFEPWIVDRRRDEEYVDGEGPNAEETRVLGDGPSYVAIIDKDSQGVGG
jgi:hypothetical protein